MTRLSPALGIAVFASAWVSFLVPSALAATISSDHNSSALTIETPTSKAESSAHGFVQTKNGGGANPPVPGGPGNTQGSGTR